MLRTFLTLAALAMLAGAALAEPLGRCDSEGQPALGIVQVTGGSADSTFYVDDRNYATGNGIWVYMEHNGLWTEKPAGVYFGDPHAQDLQRGSACGGPWSRCTVPDDGEICHDTESNEVGPDLLIF